ncbi:MAG TPA: adenosylcobinamide-GDP ribazoletransferase [Chthoniobacterales bacterium]|nr:adenosylcobinamide-GDP ribazoletransferase [Chthoniobacterales bacterium]
MTSAALVAVARHQVNTFLAAVMFLTRVPVASAHQFRFEDLALSVVYFPVVGALVGLVGGIALLTSYAMPSFLAALISMLVTLCITGGLHEDGLADCVDGLFGGQDPQRRLEIMKDSRIGTYGALALWFSLTARLILIQSLLAISVVTALLALIVAHSLGRASTAALLASLPYVRKGESKASPYGNKRTHAQISIGLLFPFILSIALLRLNGLFCVVVAVAVASACGFLFKRKIGGITGDCLGATNQLVELASYLSLIVLRPINA